MFIRQVLNEACSIQQVLLLAINVKHVLAPGTGGGKKEHSRSFTFTVKISILDFKSGEGTEHFKEMQHFLDSEGLRCDSQIQNIKVCSDAPDTAPFGTPSRT